MSLRVAQILAALMQLESDFVYSNDNADTELTTFYILNQGLVYGRFL